MVLTREPEQLLGLMENLADRARLRLLRLLEGQELGVAELVEILTGEEGLPPLCQEGARHAVSSAHRC